MAINRRINRDIKNLMTLENSNVELLDDKTIHCNILGPKDTIYDGGKWKIIIMIPDGYPFKSPSIGFIDKIWHPNVDFQSGSVCLNVLNQSWSPIYTLEHIVSTFIPQLLTYPNPDDPLNVTAAEMFLNDMDKYNETVLKYLDLDTVILD